MLHNLLGTTFSAHVLSYVYLIFLPMVPITVTIWLVWSRNVSFGYWYVTAQCICWTLGTASYYMIPTLGPNFASPWLYEDLAQTGVTQLQEALYWGRYNVRFDPLASGVQSVAGFASLHVAVTLLMALVAQYTVRHRIIKIVLWTYMVLVVISTTYFGWHYIADDIAGVVIAFVSFYLGAIATGQKFDEHGRHSHPTTTTSDVPVDSDVDRASEPPLSAGPAQPGPTVPVVVEGEHGADRPGLHPVGDRDLAELTLRRDRVELGVVAQASRPRAGRRRGPARPRRRTPRRGARPSTATSRRATRRRGGSPRAGTPGGWRPASGRRTP